MDFLILTTFAGLLLVALAQRPPADTPVIADQYSAYWTITCSPVTCGTGSGYYQRDYTTNRTFTQYARPMDSTTYYALALYNEKRQYVYNSQRCTVLDFSSMHLERPNYLKGLFFKSKSGDNFTFDAFTAPTDFKWFDDRYENHRIVASKDSQGNGYFSRYIYNWPNSIEDKDVIHVHFSDLAFGPDSLNEQYWKVPEVCKNGQAKVKHIHDGERVTLSLD